MGEGKAGGGWRGDRGQILQGPVVQAELLTPPTDIGFELLEDERVRGDSPTMN